MQVHNSVPSSLKRHIVPNLPHIQKSNFVSDELVSYLQYIMYQTPSEMTTTKPNAYFSLLRHLYGDVNITYLQMALITTHVISLCIYRTTSVGKCCLLCE